MTLTFALILLATAAQAGDPPREAFPAFVWRGSRARSSSESEAEAGLLDVFGGAEVIGADEADWLRRRGLDFYVFNAAGRGALHLDPEDPGYRRRWQAWFDGRDDADLVREPCLSDPATLRALERTLEKSLAARGGDWGRGVSLGDEVSLTPYGAPEDVCLGPSCREAWKRFLAGRSELTEADRERLADLARFSTDAVRLDLAEGRTELLGGWLLRRRFHHEVVLDALAGLADLVRRESPLAPVGLLGMAGETAFGNVPVDRILSRLDFAECYRQSDARELLFTLRAPGQEAWFTVFPEAAFPHRGAWQAWEHWMRGGDAIVIWSQAVLASSPPLAERMARAVRDIRRLEQLLPAFRPEPAGIALVHSSDSVAASWLRDALLDGPTWPKRLPAFHERTGTLEASIRAWLRFLEDQGAMPGAVPLERVGAGLAQRFPVLMLVHLLVVSDRDVERLLEFLVAGGTLVVQGDLGWIDPQGRVRAEPLIDRLRSASDQVLLAPEAIARYPSTRAEDQRDERAALVESLLGALPSLEAALRRKPWTLHGPVAERLPWLSTWSSDAGGWIGATIPNVIGEELARIRLTDVPIGIEPPAGYRVEWIHPAADPPDPPGPSDGSAVRLPAGDAAVFRIVPEEADRSGE